MPRKLILSALTFFIYSFILPTLISAIGYSFQEEFNQERLPNTLNQPIWILYPNTFNNAATIQEGGGYLQMSQQNYTHQFPLIISNDILPENDFSVDIKFQYNQVTGWGTGFALTEATPTNGGGFLNVFTISIWQDTMPYRMRVGYGDGMGAERIVYQTSSMDTDEHLFTVKYLNQKYFIYLDRQLIYSSQNTNKKLKYLWLGNPDYLNSSVPSWTSFKLDYIRISTLPSSFLDLPWDYSGKGLSFNDAALSINSFFDHQYPLLSRGLNLAEPATASANLVNYLGQTTSDPYSKHDGYDWGNTAKAKLGDPVLAAASGSATYINSCSSCGNMIVIDHNNGYQTRYMHLQKDGLITQVPNQPVSVTDRQQIGKVGFTGNVWPNDERGAHIHFGVFQDKDGDGDFTNNEPDGVTDPFGWQSDTVDPWPNYTFNYLGQNRTGNKSYYLWKNNLASMISTITSESITTMNVGNYTLTFPQNSTTQNIIVNAKSAPIAKTSNNLVSVGSTLFIKATDLLGNPITNFLNLYEIVLDFSSLDISKLKADTLSFYSSLDGTVWSKEDTTFSTSTSAKTQLNHFSYFALMGERRDTTPPTTTTLFSGTEGQATQFRSDVNLTLKTQDDDLGVYYTLYKINNEEWKIYESSLNFTNEGHYKVEFYSVDNDDNTEELKPVEFDIDKTPPVVTLDANPKTLWPPNNKMVNIKIEGSATDENLQGTIFRVLDEYGLIQPTITDFGQTIQLEVSRNGNDKDGRIYTIEATATDLTGNIATASAQVIVPHNQRKN